MNTLFHVDNPDILRNRFIDESVDLIHLAPPINLARHYNLLFKKRKGDNGPARIMAFEDTWQWIQARAEEWDFGWRGVVSAGASA